MLTVDRDANCHCRYSWCLHVTLASCAGLFLVEDAEPLVYHQEVVRRLFRAHIASYWCLCDYLICFPFLC